MELINILETFSATFNEHPQVNRTTRGWTVNIYLQSTTTGHNYRIVVDNGRALAIEPADNTLYTECVDNIMLRADADCLGDIFSGQRNPALAAIDGDLEVFGDEKHSIKLDAIVLIIWGF